MTGQGATYADFEKIGASKDTWFASRKLDGARCVCQVLAGEAPRFFTRGGHEIKGTEKLGEQVLALLKDVRDVVLDGELCFPETADGINKGGLEDFQSLVGEVRKNKPNLERANFCVFDFLQMEDFLRGESTQTLQERLEKLQQHFADRSNHDEKKKKKKADLLLLSEPKDKVASLQDFSFRAGFQAIWGVQQVRVTTLEWLKSVADLDTTGGWEGFILRKNAPYKGKRR